MIKAGDMVYDIISKRAGIAHYYPYDKDLLVIDYEDGNFICRSSNYLVPIGKVTIKTWSDKLKKILKCDPNFDVYIKCGESSDEMIYKIMSYKIPNKILDKEERKYLSDFLRPFKDRISFICKIQSYDFSHLGQPKCQLLINIKHDIYDEVICLPEFSKFSNMYSGMEEGRQYSTRELDLFINEKGENK